MKLLFLIAHLCLALTVMNAAFAKDHIVLWKRNFDRPAHLSLVDMAARLSEQEYGPYEIVPSTELVQGRAFVSLSQGQLVNVIIGAMSSDRERQGLPIYLPLDRGILGFKVCLQNSSSKPYQNIRELKDFNQQQIVIGVGSHWPDRHVLESNDVTVSHSPLYEQLFKMLEKKRFDCLLRSPHEIEDEQMRFADLNLNIEPNIGIVYPQAEFAFVSIHTPKLRERLEFGLHKAIENGDFYEHFNLYYGSTLKSVALYERKLLLLENSDLSIEARDAINHYGLASFALPSH